MLSPVLCKGKAAKGYKLSQFNMFIFPSIKAAILPGFLFILVELDKPLTYQSSYCIANKPSNY